MGLKNRLTDDILVARGAAPQLHFVQQVLNLQGVGTASRTRQMKVLGEWLKSHTISDSLKRDIVEEGFEPVLLEALESKEREDPFSGRMYKRRNSRSSSGKAPAAPPSTAKSRSKNDD